MPVPMGERVSVGSVTYNVFQADWRSDLETPSGRRYPRHRFLVVRLSITNGAGENVNIPLLRVEDAGGKTYMEEDSAEGVDGWLGLLRIIAPAHTEEGAILFDVPPGNYKLHVVDGGDLEQQKVRFVEIPYTIAAPVQVKPPSD
jgi:Telomeric repeat-binding factor 2.